MDSAKKIDSSSAIIPCLCSLKTYVFTQSPISVSPNSHAFVITQVSFLIPIDGYVTVQFQIY